MNIFEKTFTKLTLSGVFQFLGIVAIFDWIVFPGLTVSDTISNILSFIVAIFTLVYLWYLLGLNEFVSKIWKSEK